MAQGSAQSVSQDSSGSVPESGEMFPCLTAGHSEPPFHLGHRRWLDGLRGIAVLIVVAYHVHLIKGGCFGVDIFFVLSGFLITTLLVEEWRVRGAIDLKRFYARRILRLVPALYVMLGIGWLYNFCFRSSAELSAYVREMIVAGCYVTNWPDWHKVPGLTIAHTWSLSVEEQFYLLWPPVLLVMLRARLTPRAIAVWLCAGAFASAALRRVLFERGHAEGYDHMYFLGKLYIGLHTRADSLLIGCLIGVLAGWNLLSRSPRYHRLVAIASVAAAAGLVFMLVKRDWYYTDCFHGLYTAVAAAVAVLLIHLLQSPSRWALMILESRPLVGVGRISYAVYLYHIPIIRWLYPEQLGWKAPAETVTVVALSLAAAVASYYVVERPCLRWKSRLQPLVAAARAADQDARDPAAEPRRVLRHAA